MAMETTAAPDTTDLFQQLKSYPWENDAEFQGGLSAILGSATEPSQINELTLRAQVFYFSRKKSIPVDFDAYKDYLSCKSTSYPPPSTVPPSSAPLDTTAAQPSTTSDPPAAAPIPSETNPALTFKPAEAPYPQTFAEIVALITSGSPIPGIKDIPPTVLSSQATKPVASKRRKPWETDTIEEVGGTFGDRRDDVIIQELPE